MPERAKAFGAELLDAPLPQAPEGISHDEWQNEVRANRATTLSGFTASRMNNDAFNDVLAIKLHLESLQPGSVMPEVPLRLYKDYFAEKSAADPASLKFIIDNSDPEQIDAFDVEIMNIRNAISKPLTEESIREIRRGLRKIYVVLYGREPSHF